MIIRKNRDKNKDYYVEEFLNKIEYLKPKIMIHFKSNICYLHKDSIRYNEFSKTSDQLKNYYL